MDWATITRTADIDTHDELQSAVFHSRRLCDSFDEKIRRSSSSKMSVTQPRSARDFDDFGALNCGNRWSFFENVSAFLLIVLSKSVEREATQHEVTSDRLTDNLVK